MLVAVSTVVSSTPSITLLERASTTTRLPILASSGVVAETFFLSTINPLRVAPPLVKLTCNLILPLIIGLHERVPSIVPGSAGVPVVVSSALVAITTTPSP